MMRQATKKALNSVYGKFRPGLRRLTWRERAEKAEAEIRIFRKEAMLARGALIRANEKLAIHERYLAVAEKGIAHEN